METGAGGTKRLCGTSRNLDQLIAFGTERCIADVTGPTGVAIRERRRTIAIVAEWWSIEVLHEPYLDLAAVFAPAVADAQPTTAGALPGSPGTWRPTWSDTRPETTHGVRSDRGSCRRRDATGSTRCRRCSRRLVLVTAISASTGAIRSAAAASARCSTAGRRSGAGVGDQVTVTDSHHPALRMAPAESSRRQCPRDTCTWCCQSPWLSRGRE